MKKTKEPEVKRLVLESYLAVIKNSVGTEMFKNFYAKVDGRKKDVMKDGWLSCALYVSAILSIFELAKSIHGTVASTIKDLEESGWKMIRKPRPGSVVIWQPYNVTKDGIAKGHRHIGFYVGSNSAISNDSWKKYPIKHPWTFGGKRKVEMVLWNPRLK